MPFNMQQQETGKNMTAKQAQSSFPKSDQKAPGTRIGVLIDWRGDSIKSGKIVGRYGYALRDGR